MKLIDFIKFFKYPREDWQFKLTFSIGHETKEIASPSWGAIKWSLNQLDGHKYSYMILENKNGDYLQCAGTVDKMKIEYREVSGIDFKHYTLGHGGERSPIGIIWVYLETGIGKLSMHEEEVLKICDALRIFKTYFDESIIPKDLTKRNVTQMFRTINMKVNRP